MTLDLQATPDEVMRAVHCLEAFAREHHLDDNTAFAITLALEECASNVVNYALERDPSRTFRVSFEKTGSAVRIEVRDPGPEFDPTLVTRREPRAGDDAPPGGWGIALVRRFIDDLVYRREAGENILNLTKYLEEPQRGAATHFQDT